jgi:hypothetical protein
MWEKIKAGKLTREDMDYIFHSLMGNSGAANGGYKLGGWCFPFGDYMKTYLVKYSHTTVWIEIKAFDKTCIRSSYYTNRNILRIIEMPEK